MEGKSALDGDGRLVEARKFSIEQAMRLQLETIGLTEDRPIESLLSDAGRIMEFIEHGDVICGSSSE